MRARKDRDTKTRGIGIPAIALAILAGCVLVQGLHALPPRRVDQALLAGGLLLALACLRWRVPRSVLWLALAVAAFGWTAWRADLALSARLPHALEKQDIVVTGVVTGLPQAQDAS
ncbi:MAG TPA: DUF4131 domain-containing protein, partial [Rhodanobacteraceae bacterium]|nr:DUF4131 domain-containing protein [Rhodanobacteraceae bacterium]